MRERDRESRMERDDRSTLFLDGLRLKAPVRSQHHDVCRAHACREATGMTTENYTRSPAKKMSSLGRYLFGPSFFFLLPIFFKRIPLLFFFFQKNIFSFSFFLFFSRKKFLLSFFSCISFKYVLLLALVSEFNCFLRSRCFMES